MSLIIIILAVLKKNFCDPAPLFAIIGAPSLLVPPKQKTWLRAPGTTRRTIYKSRRWGACDGVDERDRDD